MINELTDYSTQPDANALLPVRINGQEQSLRLLNKLRALPRRRAVFKAQWQGECVLVKVFVGNHRERDAMHEEQGIAALEKAGVATSPFLAKGILSNDQGIIVITKWLEDAKSLAQIWDAATTDVERTRILKQAVTMIAKQHEAGLLQKDIHLDNFLQQNSVLYTVDGGGVDVCQAGASLPASESLNNLALFFAQLSPMFDAFITSIVSTYNQQRHIVLEPNHVLATTTKQRQKRLRHFLSKVYRNCSEFICDRSWREYRVYRRDTVTPGMARWFDSLDEMLEAAKKPAKIKNSHTNVVARLEYEGHSFIVKRYNIKGFWHALSRCWRPSRAWVAWRNGNRLRFLGIATPQPIALIEKRFGPLRGVAYIIMQAIDGVPLSKLPVIDQSHIKQTAQQILQLAAANISHGDMKASNFMVSDKDVYLIDLDSMKQHHSALVFKKMFKEDMERFMRNWQQQPEVAAAFQVELKSVI